MDPFFGNLRIPYTCGFASANGKDVSLQWHALEVNHPLPFWGGLLSLALPGMDPNQKKVVKYMFGKKHP